MIAVLEKSNELPDGWKELAIEDIAEVNPRVNKSEIPDDLAVSFVPMPAVETESGAIDVSQERPFSEVKKGFTPFKEGDVLFAKITPCMENGKMAVVPKLKNGYGFGSTEFHVLRPKEGIESKYIYYFVSSRTFRGVAQHNMSGAVGQKRVPTNYLKQHLIPVAPPEQQKRIVAKIEELFSHIDAGIEALKKAKQLLKQYRQSVLKAAVTGELTKEWREANKDKLEPASQLLERILKERRKKWEEQRLEQFKAKGKMPKDDKWKEKYKEPVSKISIDAELPEGWKICVLDQLITELKNGISKKPTEETGLAIFRISAVRPMEVKKDDVRFLPKNFDASGFEIENGDLLFTRYNGNPELVGVCGKVRGLQRETVYPDKLMRARLVNQEFVSTDYLELSLNCGISKEFIRSSTKTTAGQSGIAGGDVKKCPVVMPGYEEQMQIAAIAYEKFTAIEHLDAELDQQLIKAEKNKQSVLASAFTGELN